TATAATGVACSAPGPEEQAARRASVTSRGAACCAPTCGLLLPLSFTPSSHRSAAVVLWTILTWVGRIGFAFFFIMSGVNHFKNAKGITGYAQSKGVPAAAVGVPVSGAMLIAGGVLILFSWHARSEEHTSELQSLAYL